MGLFDNLLGGDSKKEETPTMLVQSAQSTQAIPQGTTATSAAIDDMLNLAAGNVTTEMPSYTAQKAQEATSPVVVESSPVITSEATSPVVVESSPVITSEATSPVVVESSPVITSEATSPVVVESSPVIVDSTSTIEATPTTNSNTEVSEMQATSDAMEPMTETSAIKVQNNILGITESDSLFGNNNIQETIETQKTTENLEIEKGENVAKNQLFQEMNIETTMQESNKTPDNTESFLTSGLEQLAKMEEILLSRKKQFLNQAEEYRTEKEKYAELEEKAIADSKSMDNEQKRINSMKQYFTKQLEGANINDSVNTALTGIGVKNAVDKTIEKKTNRPKKATVHA